MTVRIEAQSEPIPGYRLIERIGSGGFGEVWKVEAPGGIFKAIKIIHGDLRSKDSDLTRYAEQELKALKRVKQVRHPYLLALDRYDIVDGRLLITMELADCNLWDRLRECRDRGLPGIPRDELLVYMAETAEVLDLFNDQYQLQHLDIKPQNLFLLYNHVKVADFGQVKDLQGLLAQVTGGITPVYAAPETFDGLITRYCDQYSLACVYQELLTGVRPFDGCSMSQLLMQHLHLPPNLSPSPEYDRPVLARALAKKPEDRWPTVTAFVRALYAASPSSGSASGRVSVPLPRVAPEYPTQPAPSSNPDAPPVPTAPAPLPPLVLPGDTPAPRQAQETTGPVYTPTPPEERGPGPLRPALVIGLGLSGLRVLQRLRFELARRYGPREMTPAVRTLYVDTDPDSLDEAGRPRPLDRLAALGPDEVFPARLNRSAHYLRPRFNGRSLIEGWLDPQLLYRIPRTPQTLGLRQFGRLAFCDHFRPLLGKIQSELETALAADSLSLTEARTGLKRRTNRPRVYIVAGLAGGTGSGMFLDLAYAVQVRLKRMGYDTPELVGVFILPPPDSTVTPTLPLANTYAALVELNHFSRPDTLFAANYDDRNGAVREKGPPFTRCYFVPGSAVGPPPPPSSSPTPPRHTPSSIPNPPNRPRTPGSGSVIKPGSRVLPTAAAQRTPDPATLPTLLKPYSEAADLIRLNLFSLLGRTADEARPIAAEDDRRAFTVTAFGMSGFDWPRSEVVSRTAVTVAGRLLRHWATPDPQKVREVIPSVAQDKWSQLGLDPDTLLGHLGAAADQVAGSRVEELIALTADPLVPRGWLARLPDPTAVTVALDRLLNLLGPPASPVKRPPTAVEQALTQKAAELGTSFAADVRSLVPALIDDPQYRLAGTEALIRQFLATTDRLIDQFQNSACELDRAAQAGFECVSLYAHFQKGMRKPSAADFGEAVRHFPRARFQALTQHALVSIYQAVRDAFTAHLSDVVTARQRLEDAIATVEALAPPAESPASNRRLLPAGCASVDDAVERFLAVIGDPDLAEIDRRAVGVIEPELGGLVQACLSSTSGPADVAAVVFEETRSYLEARLGAVDFAAMFAERFRSPQQAERVLEQTYQEAEPAWVGSGPWAAHEVTVLGCPDGPGGEPLRELARRALPVTDLAVADTPDDLTVYREWPDVPLAALPHLGPAAAAAYQELPEVQQCSAHARLDVTLWRGVDEP